MRVWLVTVGEPLPMDGAGVRLLRTGLLAQELARRGHEVVWWNSTFDHTAKRQRFDRHTTLPMAPGITLRLLHANAYRRNVSFARIANHIRLGRAFAREAATQPAPHVVACSYPPIELALAAVRHGARHGVPVVLDVRDLWPDAFLDLAPAWLRPALRLALAPWRLAARAAFAGARAVTGVTHAYVDFGLEQAGRARREEDLAFPLGYAQEAPPHDAQRAAKQFWAEKLGSPRPEEFLCCFFGTIGAHVDLDPVLTTARAFQVSHPGIRFVVCGAGDDLERYQRQAAGLANVLFPGWIHFAHIWALMQRAAVGLAPYADNENFRRGLPNKPIEYFSAGLPVLSSVDGVLGELLRTHRCGLVYGAGGAPSFAARLTELYNDPALRRDLASNAKSLFEQRFTAERVYAGMADYLERLAGSAPRS